MNVSTEQFVRSLGYARPDLYSADATLSGEGFLITLDSLTAPALDVDESARSLNELASACSLIADTDNGVFGDLMQLEDPETPFIPAQCLPTYEALRVDAGADLSGTSVHIARPGHDEVRDSVLGRNASSASLAA